MRECASFQDVTGDECWASMKYEIAICVRLARGVSNFVSSCMLRGVSPNEPSGGSIWSVWWTSPERHWSFDLGIKFAFSFCFLTHPSGRNLAWNYKAALAVGQAYCFTLVGDFVNTKWPVVLIKISVELVRPVRDYYLRNMDCKFDKEMYFLTRKSHAVWVFSVVIYFLCIKVTIYFRRR
jgi:hypothetical protein